MKKIGPKCHIYEKFKMCFLSETLQNDPSESENQKLKNFNVFLQGL